jgi:hypothetical protein
VLNAYELTAVTIGTNGDIYNTFNTPRWSELYEAWNLPFILGNLPNMDALLPKLVIPLVIDADELTYIWHRGLTLWVAINFDLIRYAKNANVTGHGEVKIPAVIAKNIATVWGKINKDLAAEIVKSNAPPLSTDINSYEPNLESLTADWIVTGVGLIFPSKSQWAIDYFGHHLHGIREFFRNRN